MLERFEYDGNGFIDLENFETPLLTFPPNLNELSIRCRDFINIDLSTLMLPPTLIRLELLDLSLMMVTFIWVKNCNMFTLRHPHLHLIAASEFLIWLEN